MAADHDLDDVPVASEDEYKEETQHKKWVVLEDAYMKVEVITAPPYKFLSKLEQYGLQDMVDDSVDVDTIDEQEAQQKASDLSGFMQDVVVDRVVTPYGYWGDDAAVSDDTDGFDCSELSENDMSALITGIIGQSGGDAPDGFDPDRFQE
jgi:hypothetical protein